MTEKALLAEALDQPADDEPRLILADWYDEHEDPRGEYIRVQCQLAAGKSPSGTALDASEYQRLRKRESELADDVRQRWEPHVPRRVVNWRCVRGLPGQGSVRLADFAALAKQICSQMPLENVTLTGRAGDVAALARCPELAQIRQLRLHNNLAAVGALHALWKSSYLGSLQTLQVDDYGFSREEMLTLGAGRHTPSLMDLRLQRVQFPDHDPDPLTTGTGLASLEVFQLNQSIAASTFLRSASFGSRLRVLDLDYIRGADLAGLGSPMIVLLDRRKNFRELTHLNVGGAGITNETFTQFVSANRFPRLATLAADVGEVHDDGAFVLAASKMIQRLWRVKLSRHQLSEDGIRALWESPQRRPQAVFWLTEQASTSRDGLRRLRRKVNRNFHL